eukprot:9160896-Pyramimonas_sp.AAC.1
MALGESNRGPRIHGQSAAPPFSGEEGEGGERRGFLAGEALTGGLTGAAGAVDKPAPALEPTALAEP